MNGCPVICCRSASSLAYLGLCLVHVLLVETTQGGRPKEDEEEAGNEEDGDGLSDVPKPFYVDAEKGLPIVAMSADGL